MESGYAYPGDLKIIRQWYGRMPARKIASPLAWWFMQQWLQGFFYRTTISWWIFAVAGLSAMSIALVTVSFQAIKAATANPVKSLRAE
jgi:putative ABC transport system permease protein